MCKSSSGGKKMIFHMWNTGIYHILCINMSGFAYVLWSEVGYPYFPDQGKYPYSASHERIPILLLILKCLKYMYMIKRIIHDLFHIGPGIIPRPILTLDCVSGWYQCQYGKGHVLFSIYFTNKSPYFTPIRISHLRI